jgi:hypothetical protein
MTLHPKVSHCANPKCNAEFKRMGQGRLVICPSDPEVTVNHLRQKVIWLCDACAREFEAQFEPNQHKLDEVDRPHQSY